MLTNTADPAVSRHASLAGAALPPPDVQDSRPVMTEKELTLHTTVAGIRAREEAEKASCSPAAMHALAAGAAAERGDGFLDIDGIICRPVSIAVIWAMELADPFLQQTDASRGGDWALLAWVVTQPEAALSAALEKRWQAFAQGAFDLALSGTVTPTQGQAIDEWYTGEIKRLRSIAGAGENQGTAAAVGKASAASNT